MIVDTNGVITRFAGVDRIPFYTVLVLCADTQASGAALASLSTTGAPPSKSSTSRTGSTRLAERQATMKTQRQCARRCLSGSPARIVWLFGWMLGGSIWWKHSPAELYQANSIN